MKITRKVCQAIAGQNHLAESDITCGTNVFRIQKEKTVN